MSEGKDKIDAKKDPIAHALTGALLATIVILSLLTIYTVFVYTPDVHSNTPPFFSTVFSFWVLVTVLCVPSLAIRLYINWVNSPEPTHPAGEDPEPDSLKSHKILQLRKALCAVIHERDTELDMMHCKYPHGTPENEAWHDGVKEAWKRFEIVQNRAKQALEESI